MTTSFHSSWYDLSIFFFAFSLLFASPYTPAPWFCLEPCSIVFINLNFLHTITPRSRAYLYNNYRTFIERPWRYIFVYTQRWHTKKVDHSIQIRSLLSVPPHKPRNFTLNNCLLCIIVFRIERIIWRSTAIFHCLQYVSTLPKLLLTKWLRGPLIGIDAGNYFVITSDEMKEITQGSRNLGRGPQSRCGIV